MPQVSPAWARVATLAAFSAIAIVALPLKANAEHAPAERISGRVDGRNGARSAVREHDGVHTSFATPAAEIAEPRSEENSNAVAPATKSLPLSSKRLPAAKGETPTKASGWSTLLSALGSLAVVLGLFLAVVWFLRRTSPKSMTALPSEVFEVLGRSTLAARQRAQLVRCGSKLLLISVTAGGAETLTEITEPAEVERLVGLCQQSRPNSATASFRNLFSQFGSEPQSEARIAARQPRAGLGLLRRASTEVADA
jgi:flagellar biogenesis protein FliO